MSEQEESRLALELSLLQAIYPAQIECSDKSREVKFTDKSALLQLRLPETYPDAGFPDIIVARDASKNDVRDATKAAVQEAGLAQGEEALDAIIACFLAAVETNHQSRSSSSTPPTTSTAPESYKTVIIWLHHLLALSKRKLALSAPQLSGITKPGYPGIMIFSGPESAVNEQVEVLKGENWQAFQVRFEEKERWVFGHGMGMREVESMADVVRGLDVEGGQGQKQKQRFLTAAGIK